MLKFRFFSFIGMAGVSEHESPTARLWARRLDICLVPIALLSLFSWYDSKAQNVVMNAYEHQLTDWAMWFFFVTEWLLLSALVKNRSYYWRTNWFSVAILIGAMPLLWNQQELGMLRVLRFLVVILKLANFSDTIRAVLARNNLGITLVVSWVFVLCAGMLMAAIDPAFHSIADGMWWAWVTVTTVGYGDIVPVSNAGRLLAGFLMLVGLSLFSLITAGFSALFVARDEKKIVRMEREGLQQDQQIIESEQRIIQHLEKIEQRLGELEKRIEGP